MMFHCLFYPIPYSFLCLAVPAMGGSVNLYSALSCGIGVLCALKITSDVGDSEGELSCWDGRSSTGEFGDT